MEEARPPMREVHPNAHLERETRKRRRFDFVGGVGLRKGFSGLERARNSRINILFNCGHLERNKINTHAASGRVQRFAFASNKKA